jgi:hypothetical protein
VSLNVTFAAYTNVFYRPLRISKSSQGDTIRMDNTEIVSEDVGWIRLIQNRSMWAHGNGMSVFTNVGNFLI